MTTGVLVVNKPAGMTSHDVVNRVRRLAGIRRVGHTGTLDPMATGVLVLLLGPATRLSRFAAAGKKRYEGVIRLGQTTTTYDAEGTLVEERTVDVALPEIREALTRFTGRITQIPPMYAAIKVGGQKLYELARKGQEIEREPRVVTIYTIDLLDWSPPDVTVAVTCSSGTYIRSLAHDLGQALGCGAHLHALRRTANGPFKLAQSHSLADLQQLRDEDRFEDALRPPHAALGSMPVAVLSPAQEQAVRYGQQIALSIPGVDTYAQARDRNNRLIAVLTKLDESLYRPTVVLPPTESTGGPS